MFVCFFQIDNSILTFATTAQLLYEMGEGELFFYINMYINI